ncbi:MAG: mucin9, partial [Candidatus Eremiobacteraeota bacterium]|nr:mucin9 [Candidatus Eremiobacteraeota bacterium]
ASAATITLYGYNVNAIYTISTSTGTATSIHTFSPALKQAAALATRASDGMIFYTDYDSGTTTTTVFRWDPAVPATAAVRLGTTGVPYLPRSAFAPDGTLYAMDQSSTHIYSIDQTTGAATSRGTVTGIATGGGDMAFGPTGTLYVGAVATIYTVPVTGGAATTLASFAMSGSITGMAFDANGRLLMSTDDTPARIYAMTPPSVTVTQVGTVGGFVTLGDLASVVAPDVQITKSHTGYFIAQGPAKAYTLLPKNSGDAVTSGTITVTDVLPAGLTYVSATGTGWSCSASAQTMTCTSTTAIAVNANGNAITLDVTAGTAGIPSVTNTASIAGGNQPALFAGNDTSSDLTYVGGLKVVKTADKTTVVPGDVVTFTLSYTNGNPVSGGSAFQSIVLNDTIPGSMAFVSANCGALPASLTSCTVTPVAVGGGGTVKWTLAGSLNVGNSGTVALKLKVL